VRILDNFDPQAHPSGPTGLPEDVELVYGDIRDPQTIARALQGIDYVVHFAAVVGVGQSMYEINRYCDVNVMGTAVLLEALSKARGFKSSLLLPPCLSMVKGHIAAQIADLPLQSVGSKT
jgi:nucleoside-diphosphate-sugar epimerase